MKMALETKNMLATQIVVDIIIVPNLGIATGL